MNNTETSDVNKRPVIILAIIHSSFFNRIFITDLRIILTLTDRPRTYSLNLSLGIRFFNPKNCIRGAGECCEAEENDSTAIPPKLGERDRVATPVP